MREKLKIAKKLNTSRKNFSVKREHKKLFKKIYHTYIIQCIILRKDTFQLTFNGVHIYSFGQRIKNWWNYILYPDIYFKPVHVKVSKTPNEAALEYFLKKNGFKIVEEHLSAVRTVYDIARI